MQGDLPGILIVDDNDDDRYTLQLLLENDGYTRITIATGGQEALALLARENFSLILLDMMMPGMAGDEVLKIIKDNPQTRDTPVVVLSADSDSEKISKCISIGADDYLPKPFNPRELVARIRAILRRATTDEPRDEVRVPIATRALIVGDVKLDPGTRVVTRGGVIVELTAVEFDLFVRHRHRLLNLKWNSCLIKLICQALLIIGFK